MSLAHISLYALGIWIHADTIAYYTNILSIIVLPLVALECWKSQSCNNGQCCNICAIGIYMPQKATIRTRSKATRASM